MARVYSTLEQKQKVWPRVVEVMNSTGAVWWLADGTALGAYRSGDFIPGDSDIDLGMWATDRRKAIRVLRQLGKFSLPNHGQPGTLVDGTVPVGIHLHEIHGSTVVYPLGRKAQIGYCFPMELFQKLHPVELCGRRVLMPSPPERYLELHYGPDWRVPNPGWRWKVDPPCLIRYSSRG